MVESVSQQTEKAVVSQKTRKGPMDQEVLFSSWTVRTPLFRAEAPLFRAEAPLFGPLAPLFGPLAPLFEGESRVEVRRIGLL